jgi:hypothetical protein
MNNECGIDPSITALLSTAFYFEIFGDWIVPLREEETTQHVSRCQPSVLITTMIENLLAVYLNIERSYCVEILGRI